MRLPPGFEHLKKTILQRAVNNHPGAADMRSLRKTGVKSGRNSVCGHWQWENKPNLAEDERIRQARSGGEAVEQTRGNIFLY